MQWINSSAGQSKADQTAPVHLRHATTTETSAWRKDQHQDSQSVALPVPVAEAKKQRKEQQQQQQQQQ
ncbi:GL19607 [Drosophila persimilis]|uniref:GL19607 n=1 Tax=Drosophila persimilis TaxID=7234 RepID=B4G7C6_DROPE|nr:GL19607 [Drosophila persimilis]